MRSHRATRRGTQANSCLYRVERDFYLIIRRSYVDICGGSHCAAAILANFEYWTNRRLGEIEDQESYPEPENESSPRRKPLTSWIYKTGKKLSEELIGLYNEKTTRGALQELIVLGLLEKRQNPYNPLDRTPQFKLSVEQVNAALRAYERDVKSGELDSALLPSRSKQQNVRVETVNVPTNKETIQTETSTSKPQIESSSSPPDRKPRQKEDDFTAADIQQLTDAIATYAAPVPAISARVARLVREAEPSMPIEGISVLVHWSVPEGLTVRSAGYWLTAIPNFMSGLHYTGVKALLLPKATVAAKMAWVERCISFADKSEPDRRYAEIWRKYWPHDGNRIRAA